MHPLSASGPEKRKTVPVELIVIGGIVALGVVLSGGSPKAEETPAPEAAASVPVERSEAEEESVVQEAASEPVAAAARVSARPAGPQLPAGFPADAPTLPDATLVSASVDTSNQEFVLIWATSAEAGAAALAYGALLAEKGWTVTSTTDNAESTVLVFERQGGKGGGRGWIAFLGSAPDVSATLTLSLIP